MKRMDMYAKLSCCLSAAALAWLCAEPSASAALCSGTGQPVCISTDVGGSATSVTLPAGELLRVVGTVAGGGTIRILVDGILASFGSSPFGASLTLKPGAHSIVAVNSIQGKSPTIAATIVKASPGVSGVTLPKTSFALVEGATVSAIVSGPTLSGTVEFLVVNSVTNEVLTFAPVMITGGPSIAPVKGFVGFPRGGLNHVVVRYDGNAFNSPASASVDVTVSRVASTTHVSASVDPAIDGQPFTLAASVSGIGVTGSVTFFDGGTALGTVSLPPRSDSATVHLPVMLHGVTAHAITAVYSGNESDNTSTSAPLNLSVVIEKPTAAKAIAALITQVLLSD